MDLNVDPALFWLMHTGQRRRDAMMTQETTTDALKRDILYLLERGYTVDQLSRVAAIDPDERVEFFPDDWDPRVPQR